MTHQRITFTATLDIDTDMLDWVGARRAAVQALLDGDGHDEPWSLEVQRVTTMQIVSED
jgi:hypothetical protein